MTDRTIPLSKRPRPGDAPGAPRLSRRLRGVAITGGVMIFGFMGGFAVWAATAPLSAGAVVRGSLGPEASRKSVSHLEGGIVREILVKEGDFVKRGQPLLTLERAQAAAAVDQVRSTLSRREAEAARLSAELSGQASPDFSAAIAVGVGDPALQEFIAGQQRLFDANVSGLSEKKDLLETQITKLHAQVEGQNAQIAGLRDQRKLIDIQIEDTEALLDKGLARKPQMLDLQRRRSELDTQILTTQSDIKRAGIETVEKQISLRSTESTYLSDTSNELAKARGEIASFRSKLDANDDVLTRTQVLAPDTGYVLNLQMKTLGGVVKPGAEILQIVPTEGDLVIEGRISPQEIRNIAPGEPAQVSFTSFPMREMPMIPGRVLKVAADSMTDPQTRETYYTAQIAVDRTVFAAYANPAELKPGTPVEAYVEAKKRVAMEYFLGPVVHSFRKSFREQ